MSNIPRLWNALSAQVMALRKKRPVVTQVEEGVWCIYAPSSGNQVIGGVLSRDKAVNLARITYGTDPVVHDEVFDSVKVGNPFPQKKLEDIGYFSTEVELLIKEEARLAHE